MSRTKNAVRNMGWGLIQKVSTLLFPFITRTVLIKVLGGEYLGLSGLFTSVLSLLSLAELGLSNCIVSAMYKPIAERDTDTICALMAVFRKSYYIIGCIIAGAGLVFMPFLPSLINGEIPNAVNIYVLYIIYLANSCLTYFLFAYKNCLFVAHQRNDVNSRIQVICSTIQNILQIIILLGFKNYYCYVIIIPVMSIAVNLITAYLANKSFPEYVCRGELDVKIKNDMKKRITGLMVGRVSATIRSTIDSIFISAFLGLKAVGMYSNYFYVVTSIAGVIQLIEPALVAGVGNSIVVDTVEKNHNDFKRFTFILQWIVGWCSICIFCLIQPFMQLWLGESYMFHDSMAILCAVYLFVNCICLIRSIYTQALGMWWSLRYLSVIDMFVNLFLNYYLGKTYGAYGIILATIVDIVVVSIPWTTYFLFRDYFGINKYLQYIGLYIKYFLIAVFVGGITYSICESIVLESLEVDFLLRVIICILVPNIMYLIILGKSKQFRDTISFIGARFKRS